MAEYSTAKSINLAQLTDEIGAAINGPSPEILRSSESKTIVCLDDTVSEEALAAAVEAHAAVFPPTPAEAIDNLPDPTVDLAAFKTALKAALGV